MTTAFPTAAKEEMFSSFGPWCADKCIRAFESEGEKSHQGFFGKTTLSPGITWSKSATALGLRGVGRENRVGSRCTGKERDSESGLDNFGFRYYGSSLGRFMKPDNGSAQDSDNPQSWNLYSYVMNQPTTATDPDGHDCIYVDSDSGKMTGFNRGDCDNSTEEKANSGIYVNGTVDSFHYDQASGSLDYGYTDENGNAGVGTILGVTPPKLSPMDNGAVTPGMLGPGDLILFSGVKTPSFVTDALGKVLGSIFGKTVEETGAAVEEIVAKAGSSVGNQSIKASSRAAAEEAAEKWVGAGARPIMREGEQVGFVSADGTKVARWTSAGKPDPYINLTNNTTGGNLHVHF